MYNDRRIGHVLRIAAALAALFACSARWSAATVRIQQEALSHGFPAGNCVYCHTFDGNHMKEQAKKQGLTMARPDCSVCHHGRLPKTGERLLNDRGRFLAAAKRQFNAERVDGAWLEKYREPSPSPKPPVASAK